MYVYPEVANMQTGNDKMHEFVRSISSSKLNILTLFSSILIISTFTATFSFLILYTTSYHTAMAAGALTSVFVKPSNNIVNTVATYEITFNTATTGTIKTITLAFPSGYNTFGAKLIERSGVGAGTVALGPTTITYSVTSPVSVPANTPVRLEFSNINNPGIAGSYAVTVTTKDSSAAVIDGPTASAAIAIKQIGTNDIANAAVTAAKLGPGAVGTAALANGAVTNAKLAPGAVLITASEAFGSTTTAHPGVSTTVVVPCPSGTIAVGGGFSKQVGLDVVFFSASGSSDRGPTAWTITVFNPTAGDLVFSPIAICASTTP
jgi:hypothetical protein